MVINKILEYLLDLVLPQPKNVRLLEAMGPAAFRVAATLGVAAINYSPSTHEKTLTLFDYGLPIVRQAIWELKYRGNKKVASMLAECLYDELVEELSERRTFENFDTPLLIPIPLSKKRLRERGFNQCELLAEILETLDHGNCFAVDRNLLIKTRDSESQTKNNRTKRQENLRGCFSVAQPEKIAGRNIIILDDVTTTGATFEEARRTLLASGARKILCLAVAH